MIKYKSLPLLRHGAAFFVILYTIMPTRQQVSTYIRVHTIVTIVADFYSQLNVNVYKAKDAGQVNSRTDQSCLPGVTKSKPTKYNNNCHVARMQDHKSD